jgi:hypothetical protein
VGYLIALLILRSTVKYWDDFISYGLKFYTGGFYRSSFPDASSRYDLIGWLGYDKEEFPCDLEYETRTGSSPLPNGEIHWNEYGDMKKICEKYSIIEKLEKDDDFRRKAYEGTLYKPKYKEGYGWY